MASFTRKRPFLSEELKTRLSKLDPQNELGLPSNIYLREEKINANQTELVREKGRMTSQIRILQKNMDNCEQLRKDIETLQKSMKAINIQIESQLLEVPRAQQLMIQRYLKTSGDITELRGLLRITSEVDSARGLMKMARAILNSAGTGFTSRELKEMIRRLEVDMVQIESQMNDVFDNVMTHEELVALYDIEGEVIKRYESLQADLAKLPDPGNLSMEHLMTQLGVIEQQIMSTTQFLREQQMVGSRQKIADYEQKIKANDELIKRYTAYKAILTETGTTPRGA
jgi:hypothetical protein